jgi:hypothetical protein
VVDNFVVVSMTEQEATEECVMRGMSPAAAKEKVRRGIEDEPVPGWVERTANDGLDRWRDALDTIELIHGKDEVAKMLEFIAS